MKLTYAGKNASNYDGNGSLRYTNELIESYVIGRQLYGRPVTEFRIEEV